MGGGCDEAITWSGGVRLKQLGHFLGNPVRTWVLELSSSQEGFL